MGISQVRVFGAPILKRHEVNIHVVSDGDLRVEERLTVEFREGSSWGDYFWEVGKEYAEGIRIEGVWEEREGTLKPLKYNVSESWEGVRVDWVYEAGEERVRVVRVVYRVKGAIRQRETGDHLWWRPFKRYHQTTVEKGKKKTRLLFAEEGVVRVFLPEGAAVQKVDLRGLEGAVKAEGRQVIFEGKCEEGQIRVQFSHGFLLPKRPSWQWKVDLIEEIWERRFFISIGFLVTALLLILRRVYFYISPFILRGKTDTKRARLPSSDPPGLIQLLREGEVDEHGIVSTIVDLARRGFLKIHELRVNGRKAIFVLEKAPAISEEQMENLRLDEATLLEALSHPSTIGNCIKRLVQSSYGEDLWGEAEKRGWFAKRKAFLVVLINFVAQAIISFPLYLFLSHLLEFTGFSLMITALIIVWGILISFRYISDQRDAIIFQNMPLKASLALGLFIILSAIFVGVDSKEWLFPGSTVLLWGAIAMQLSGPYHWYTATGLECKKQWEAFRKWLEKGSQLEREDEKILEAYLPYAIALKVEESFIKRAEKVLGPESKLSWYIRSSSAKGWTWRGAAKPGEKAAQGFSGGQRESSANGSWNDFFSALPRMLEQVASSIASSTE